jgi:hypothetical protein
VADDHSDDPSDAPASDTGLTGELGAFVDDLFDDLGKLRQVFDRAFPGPGLDERELEALRDKLRRAEPQPGLERLHRETARPTDEERAADELQAAASGKHTIYAVTARHQRSKPFTSDWVGHCQSVRVTLPARASGAEPIWTHLGVVKPSDHLAFSIEEIVAGYTAQFGACPQVERLDLVTGARHLDLDRFSPISVFLAYEHVDDSQASFYVLESGSAQGKPEVLYFAPTMGATILAEAGFAFTPFACKDNWYTGKLIMNRAKTEPSVVSISIAQEREGQRHYLDLTASFEVVAPGKVVWPIALQIEAALRVFAIAQGMGCELQLWERGLGEIARVAFDWIADPPRRGSSEGYSGCSKGPA